MPYREISEQAPCYLCERPTPRVCACCNRTVCPRHLEGTICRKCDEALYVHMKSHDGSNWLFVGLLLSVVVLFVGAFVATPLIVVGGFGLIAGPFVGLALYKRRVRAKFFAKVRKTGALPERTAADSNPDLRRLEAYVTQAEQRSQDRNT